MAAVSAVMVRCRRVRAEADAEGATEELVEAAVVMSLDLIGVGESGLSLEVGVIKVEAAIV